MSIVVKVPVFQSATTQARVGHWYYRPGEVTPRNALLVELWVGNQLTPVYAPQAGLLERIFFSEGETVTSAAVIARLKSGLPNLVWDAQENTVILDSYLAEGVTVSMEYDLRLLRRQGQQKFGKGEGNSLALPLVENRQQQEQGVGMEQEQRLHFKVNPKLQDSSQFAGAPNPRNTTIPSNPQAQRAPQNAPTLSPRLQVGPGAPTPRPMR